MSTTAQITANQANSKKSTGPNTPEGKAASSQNHRTHGLAYNGINFTVLPCENQADFDSLAAELAGEHSPAGPTEAILVERMAQHQWLRDRALRLQESCFDPTTGQIADAKMFSLYQRYATTHERAFHKCFADLLKLREHEQKMDIGFEREKRSQELFPIQKMNQEWFITNQQGRELRESMTRTERMIAGERAQDRNRRAGTPKAA